MHILVTGAAGYIGSVVVERLLAEGHTVVGLDSLTYGNKKAIHPNALFDRCDIRDDNCVDYVFRHHGPFDAVCHLAAEACIADSIKDPGLVFDINVNGSLVILQAMVRHGVKRMIFSSSAAVYGEPCSMPMKEDHPTQPVSAYGESKLATERMLEWFCTAHGINSMVLRYFNVCGATERCGEDRPNETHIIPLLLDVVQGKKPHFNLYDASASRDYVHVSDIAVAHVCALNKIDELGSQIYNVGLGRTYTNLDVIRVVENITGKGITFVGNEARPGDPASLCASNMAIQADLGWYPIFNDLDHMVLTAYHWRLDHSQGYNSPPVYVHYGVQV